MEISHGLGKKLVDCQENPCTIFTFVLYLAVGNGKWKSQKQNTEKYGPTKMDKFK
jgi:hypothetical protein